MWELVSQGSDCAVYRLLGCDTV